MVAALQTSQKALDSTAGYLAKRALDPTHPDIKAQLKQQVTDALKSAWSSILDSVNKGAIPTPTATP
jgi:hypothetical protein